MRQTHCAAPILKKRSTKLLSESLLSPLREEKFCSIHPLLAVAGRAGANLALATGRAMFVPGLS